LIVLKAHFFFIGDLILYKWSNLVLLAESVYPLDIGFVGDYFDDTDG
jgi:hypothetical protein